MPKQEEGIPPAFKLGYCRLYLIVQQNHSG